MKKEELNYSFKVPIELDKTRVDIGICRYFKDEITRSKLKKNITNLLINNNKSKLSSILNKEDIVVFTLINKQTFEKAIPENIPLNIKYEDESIIIINKPYGMTVHPAYGNWSGTLVNALLHHCKTLPGEDTVRPGIVHRLDKETSGLLICAKSDKALVKLSEAFQNRTIKKEYHAIVKGRLPNKKGLIEKPIGRHPVNRKKQGIVSNGKYALTRYKVIKEFSKYSYLALYPETGRTHQLRVHLSSINNPILGDLIYSRHDKLSEKLCLAAVSLDFNHPITNQPLNFNIELPEHMLKILNNLN